MCKLSCLSSSSSSFSSSSSVLRQYLWSTPRSKAFRAASSICGWRACISSSTFETLCVTFAISTSSSSTL
eukprot:CAMPEP_0113269796 /NCGR_PEP_ID=MMETSP0008_2-20120614/21904_1 /TAXON_ID=97485 /ORGANISM="Prymnesium parvum" /LENGTH=69 /DNA_ID=CAMNT_0000119061 /DNA_START=316 /DNA_END=525 /DNA_ORIENTATION=+ /assembly_acc=CAM_ASM_000153